MARFRDNFINLREPGISVIGLGYWSKALAPPSLFEFIQTLVVRESVASVCPGLVLSTHLGSKGCLCDFSHSLADMRLKVLNGFLCGYCRDQLKAAGLLSLADEVERLLAKDWIGDLTKPTSVASSLSKFGVNLFVTKGLEPTLRERFLNALREDGVKELIKMVYAIILAGLLAYLGWKAGH